MFYISRRATIDVSRKVNEFLTTPFSFMTDIGVIIQQITSKPIS
jgi:hypothetical protein